MPSALAIAAHPDDIEFVMAGTLLLLRRAGWKLHYLNVSTGNMGSSKMSAAKTARVRRKEALYAAITLDAKWHEPFCDDLSIFYTEENIRRTCSVIRSAAPTVILTHALSDYMEDHMITARLAVTAAFGRGIPNYKSLPNRAPTLAPCAIYHAMPHGQCLPTREPVEAEAFVNTTAVQPTKLIALASHESQAEWLDLSQGQSSYLKTMDTFSRALGRRAKCVHAEGWTRHLHFGFGDESFDPLREALGKNWIANARAARRMP